MTTLTPLQTPVKRLLIEQVRPSSGTDVYPHMPIIRVFSALDESPYELRNRIYSILASKEASGIKIP